MKKEKKKDQLMEGQHLKGIGRREKEIISEREEIKGKRNEHKEK